MAWTFNEQEKKIEDINPAIKYDMIIMLLK